MCRMGLQDEAMRLHMAVYSSHGGCQAQQSMLTPGRVIRSKERACLSTS